MFLLGIPLLLWATQRALASPEGWEQVRGTFAHPLVKLVLIGLAWSYFHHFIAGIRHLLMDLHLGMDLRPARQSAAFVLVIALLLTLAMAVRLW